MSLTINISIFFLAPFFSYFFLFLPFHIFCTCHDTTLFWALIRMIRHKTFFPFIIFVLSVIFYHYFFFWFGTTLFFSFNFSFLFLFLYLWNHLAEKPFFLFTFLSFSSFVPVEITPQLFTIIYVYISFHFFFFSLRFPSHFLLYLTLFFLLLIFLPLHFFSLLDITTKHLFTTFLSLHLLFLSHVFFILHALLGISAPSHSSSSKGFRLH